MKFLYVILFVCVSNVVFSQTEHVIFLPNEKVHLKSEETNSNSSLIELPFFDDFSYPFAVPNSNYWFDDNAFVNKSFGKNTITIGVVTLDALDDKGNLYSQVSSNPSVADYLTSQPINLKTYKKYYPTDKLYIKNPSFQLLGNEYYVLNNYTFEPLAKGLLYAAGDTIYKKTGVDFIPLIDSIFSSSFEYIEGSYQFEPKWYDYTESDSIALSFYYQSGGNADKPENLDSLVLEYNIPYQREGVFINEISQSWVEIYNATDTIVSLKNWFILNDTISNIIQKQSLESYSIKQDIKIAPYSNMIVYSQDIGISKFESTICMLYNSDTLLVDSIEVNEKLENDISYARIPDGNPQWSFSLSPSPNYPNPAWQRLWASSADTDDIFEPEYIPLSSNLYSKGFRFRFKNYVSLSNDVSHARNEDFWNIDMVWIDAQRKPSIQNNADVAFVQNISPLYNAFTAIPISHFSSVNSSNFRLTVDAKFNNFDSVYRKIKFGFQVKKQHVDEQLNYQTYETDIPGYTLGEERDVLSDWNVDFIDFMKQDIGLFDETSYEFQYYFTDNTNSMYQQYRWNDTNRVVLSMANYYAYDDGTPEAGYGLREAPMGRVAYKYSILQPDTLKGIDIYFNPTLLNIPPIFNLCIWASDTNGLPGNLLYKMPSEKVKFADGLYSFVTYPIHNEGILSGDKNGVFIQNTFFVGWEQPYDVLLNVGLDVTSTLKNKIYYNTGFEWLPSSQQGALMIRPIFGMLLPSQSIEAIGKHEGGYIYPSITQNYITVQNIGSDRYVESIVIYTVFGQRIMQYGSVSTISLESLPQGIYICEVLVSDGTKLHQKIILKK